MMKRTQLKDALRNILKQIASWLSIIVIALLGVATFLGIVYSDSALNKNGNEMYDSVNFRDIEVMSTALLTEDDLDEILKTEGVEDAEAVWQTSAKCPVGERQESVKVISLAERINEPQLIEGRLPETTGECAVEERLAEDMGWEVGDEIETLDSQGETAEYLANGSFVIVGIANHPDHTSTTISETLYVMVTKDDFDLEMLDNCSMKAEVVIEKPEGTDRFADEYDEMVEEVTDRLEELAEERTGIRDEEIKEKIEEKIEEEKAEAEAALAEAAAAVPGGVQILPVETEAGETQEEEEEELPESTWMILDCHGNASFVQFVMNCDNISSLKMTFALMFIVVGVLVIYATISKIVDEQRTLIGTGKALGQFKSEILSKYLLFGVSATLVGTFLGVLGARFLIEKIILQAMSSYYTFDATKATVDVVPTAIALVASVALAVTAICVACRKLLRLTAISLMQPAMPGGRKKAGKRRKNKRSLYSRLILLNMRSDLTRVIVTIVSVAGCCALVVIGFTLKHAVDGALEKQYTKIVDYDGKAKFDSDTSESAADEIREVLEDAGTDFTELYDNTITFRITDTLVGELLCGDVSEISSFYHLYDWKTDEPLENVDDGILIQKRTAESYDLDVGSELEVTLADGQTVTAVVSGVFDNYIGRTMVMSADYYRELTGEDCTTNMFFIRLNGADEETLLEKIAGIEGSESYTSSDSDKESFESATTIVTVIVLLFIVMAALMAAVVVMCLTNTYILQKKTEMTVMRINGFTTGEVIGYVLRETVLTTIAGILLGFAIGSCVAYIIIRTLESMFIQYDRSVSFAAWAIGAALTVFFTVVINAIVLRQVRHLKLTDMT